MNNKYEVLTNEVNECIEKIPDIAKRAIPLYFSLRFKNKKENKQKLKDLATEVQPLAKKLAHIAYETGKDLENIDQKQLATYLQSQNTDYIKYQKNLNRCIKLLLVLAILEKENIDIQNLAEPDIIINALVGKDLEALFESIVNDISKESLVIIKIISEKNFNINKLSQEQIAFLDEYHNNYMNTVLYPKISNNQIQQNKALKLAKVLASPKTIYK